MALSKPLTAQLSTQLSMDTDPMSPSVGNRFSPNFSLTSRNVSADALAGPEDASRRSTQELKEEARLAQARQSARPEQSNNPYSIEKLPPKMVGTSRTEMREELHQVETEIHSKISNLSITKGEDSRYESMSSGSSFCSSMPSVDWEEELTRYKDKMPPEIRMGYIDVLILYCEEDREKAEKFQNHLRTEICVPNGPIETLLYDDAEMQSICGSKIQHLAKGVERSTYVFIFMTKNFIEDKWCEFSSESCLMEAITNPLKQWCVVPVYTEKRNTSFRVPMGLNTLKGINYYNNDKFYRNGVSRLIGDKISVRVQANENHKIEQKKWLEDFKRKEIKLRENQERIARIEEAKTQQLVEWLDMETRRLIRDGVLPDFIHHSSSESDISSTYSTLPHSTSTSSLKPLHAQNPAVASYFQKLLGQQRYYGLNEQNYSLDEIAIIQQMYGQTSPVTPGFQNNISPPVMTLYQGRFGQGHGIFPPVASSASYEQQNQPQVKRSQSQTSADVGPSTQFQLHTDTGDISVTVPLELLERIQHLSESQQQQQVQIYIKEYHKQQQKVHNQQVYGKGNLLIPDQMMHNSENQSLNQSLHVSSRTTFAPNFQQHSTQQSSNQQGALPNLEGLYPSVPSKSYEGQQMATANYSSGNSSRSFHSGMTSGTTSYQDLSLGQPGSNTDGNRSHPQAVIGNLPNQSLLDSMSADGTPSRTSVSVATNFRREEVYQTERSHVTSPHTDSDSDEKSPIDKNKRTKLKERKVVKIYNIYQPSVVQIGDQNLVHQQADENSPISSDEEQKVSDESKATAAGDKPNEEKNSRSDEKHQLMKDIKPGSETHGEMTEQPNSAGTNSSCNVDAALSASHLSGVSQEETKTVRKKIVERKELTTIKSVKDDEEAIEKGVEVFPDDVEKEYKNNFENSSKFDESVEAASHSSSVKSSQFDESVNLNSSGSVEKASSLKRKEMPTGEKTKQDKPCCVARPVAAVSPFSPKVAEDYSDDNCDNTDPKTVIESKQTVRKTVTSSEGACSSEQTFVKQVWTTPNIPPLVKTETEELQRNSPPTQKLTKEAGGQTARNEAAKFSNFTHSNPHRLFYSRNVMPAEIHADEQSSLESGVNVSQRQEVALGNDPLSRESQEDPSSRSFVPQSSPFNPRLSDNDLEFDVLEDIDTIQSSSSFEESGTKLNKSWNKRGSPPNGDKKECIIS